MADLNAMTFGCEIECFVPNAAMREAGWSVGIHSRGNLIPGFDGWRAASDCSIDAEYGYTPVEVVSPVLRGAEGLAQVTRMAAKIRAMGGKVNRSCGFHVHVGFNRDEIDAMVRLVYLVANIETGLFAATGMREREGNDFCRSIRVGFERVQAPGRVRDVNGLAQKVDRVHDRYHTLNLSNLVNGSNSKPTAEFRVFAGTLNATKMRAYIQLALGAVQMAQEDAHRVKWQSAPRPYAFPGGRGESAVRQMLCMLGWSRNVSVSYGKKQKAFGVLDAENLPAMKKLLVQLGRKFDGGPRRASDVVVDD